MSEIEHIVRTIRVSDMPMPLPGSRVYRCELCRERVWVSESTRTSMEALGIAIRAQCNDCSDAYIADRRPETVELMLTRAVMEEALRILLAGPGWRN